jgi:TrmH family RNA methyltransferase
MLTSTKNPRIQQIRKLQSSARTRRSDQLFIVEGVRLVEEVFNTGWNPEAVFYTEDINARGQHLINSFRTRGVGVTPVAPHVMKTASDTQTPQGILAVMPVLRIQIPGDLDFMIILDGIRDPGNLGTILRTALAAGVQAALLPPGTVVDPFAPKVVRSAMGAHFQLPIHQIDWDRIRDISASLNLTHYLADSTGGQSYHQSDFGTPLALIIGGEAAGVGVEARELANNRVHINMPGEVESLNAAAAAAVLMFEVVRQRGLSIIQDK